MFIADNYRSTSMFRMIKKVHLNFILCMFALCYYNLFCSSFTNASQGLAEETHEQRYWMKLYRMVLHMLLFINHAIYALENFPLLK